MKTYSIGLSPDELVEVTGYKLSKLQVDALLFMDIPFKLRMNGTIFVSRSVMALPSEPMQSEKRAKTAIIEDF